MTSSLTVTVVIPCYNAERFVEEAIGSVFAQTRPVDEIICVDDGSTDGTAALLRRVQQSSPVPFTVHTTRNHGASHARNVGTAAARGTYIQYLDADDVLLPEKVEHQLALIAPLSEPPALVAGAYTRINYRDGRILSHVEVDPDAWRGLLQARCGITSANLWLREAVTAVGGWDEARATSEDPELVFRLLRHGGTVISDTTPLMHKRERPDSLYRVDMSRSRRRWWQLRLEILDHLDESGLCSGGEMRQLASSLFPRLRQLYRDEPELAVRVHQQLQRRRPSPGLGGCGPAYGFVYGIGGFEGAERAWRYIRRCRSASNRLLRPVRHLAGASTK